MRARYSVSAALLRTLENERLQNAAPFGVVFDAADRLPAQVRDGWTSAARLRLPKRYRSGIRRIVVTGMGGSALGAHILQSLFLTSGFRGPLTVMSGYRLPRWVDRATLVVPSSYSGSTAETLASAGATLTKGIPSIAVTSGGALAALYRRARKPVVVFPTAENPSGQPRLGIGYAVGALLALAAKLTLLPMTARAVLNAARTLERTPWSRAVPFARNAAKQDAAALARRGVLVFAPDVFLGNAHAFANQLNETAKAFAVAFPLPELNHHLLEGLQYPAALRRSVSVVFLDPVGTDPRVAERLRITEQIVRRQGFPVRNWTVPGAPPLVQALRLLQRGSYVSAYLALANGVNPVRIPWVDFLKAKLAH